MLCDTLKECNSTISKLELVGNEMDDDCMDSLGEYIDSNPCLKCIALANNKITDIGFKRLSQHLIGNTSLEYLNFLGNEGITDESAPILMDVVKKSSLTSLDLFWTSISQNQQKVIFDLLPVPVDQREIPIMSSTKSAAKIS